MLNLTTYNQEGSGKICNSSIVLVLLFSCFTLFQCAFLKSEKKEYEEYSLIGNDDSKMKEYKQGAFKFTKNENLFVVNTSFIGGNVNGIKLDYYFQIDERCKDFIRKDSVKYNVTKVSSKSINLDGYNHLFYKFYYDEHASWDEEDILIIHQDLGVIFIHRYWGERIELDNHPKLSRTELNAIKKLIKEDQNFYNTWDSCIWN